MNKEKLNQLNSLALAYLGDCVYELEIRKYLIENGVIKVKELQEKSIQFVSAKKQAYYLNDMLENHFLEGEEISIVMRARNHKVAHKPKNTDIITYKYATSLEAVIGYLYLENDLARLNLLMEKILNDKKN